MDVEISPAKPTVDQGQQDQDSPGRPSVVKAKAKGTYYPLTAFPTSMPQGPVMHKDGDKSGDRPSTPLGPDDASQQYQGRGKNVKISCINPNYTFLLLIHHIIVYSSVLKVQYYEFLRS